MRHHRIPLLRHWVSVSATVLARSVGDQMVLVDPQSNCSYSLDSVGTRVWSLILEHGKVQTVLEEMQREYPAEVLRLESDLAAFLQQLTQAGLIDVMPTED